MIKLETDRLELKNGSETEPSPEAIEQGYQRYMEGHEDPSCPFDVFRTEILFSYFQAKKNIPYGHFNIFPKGTDTTVGHCGLGLRFCDPAERNLIAGDRQARAVHAGLEMDVGWAVMKDHRNQGFATEAAQCVVDYFFASYNLERIIASTDRHNGASQRVMEKLGMRLCRHQNGVGITGVLENPQS
ncbi:MAG: GNAT family N-acetyltransferase [Candidatus Latescibacteria bacterium]|nr:GNAT family N-acetyltransferase [Candidatus Latescibacterota bacterium]